MLIKDLLAGPFSTREIEEMWGVSVLKTEMTRFGWAWAKLEPLFLAEKQRCLVLDADILFVGPVLGVLEPHNEDFVVSPEETGEPGSAFIKRNYYDYEALRALDPNFEYPGFTFNAGQFVATSGLIKREDFASLVDWNCSPPRLVRPDIFACADQGVLNYMLAKKAQESRITLGKAKFMVWSGQKEAQGLELKRITHGDGYPFLPHWAGLNHPYSFRKMVLGELLLRYEAEYYSKIHSATLKRLGRHVRLRWWRNGRRLKEKLGWH